jgi:hypothetical protein
LPESSINAPASAFSGFWRSSSVRVLTLVLASTLALILAPTLRMALTTVALARSVRIRPTTHSTPPQARHLR